MRPAGAALGGLGAGDRDQPGLLLAIQLQRPWLRTRLADEDRVQPLFHEALPQPMHGRGTDLERLGDSRIRPPRPPFADIRLQEDLGPQPLVGSPFAGLDQGLQQVRVPRKTAERRT